MKHLIALCLLLMAASAMAAATKIHELPVLRVLRNESRMYVHDPYSGSKNLTGSGFKSIVQQVAWPETTRIFQTASSAAQINAAYVIRDRRGVVRRIQWEDGGFFHGIPGYNHVYVYPFNGMTNVRRNTPLVIGTYWLTRGHIGRQITIPGVAPFTVSALKYMGKVDGLPNFDFIDPAADQRLLDAFYWGTSSVGALAPNTTYTVRSALAAAWGGIQDGMYSIGTNPCTFTYANGSSAKVMDQYSSAFCRSTFRTGSI